MESHNAVTFDSSTASRAHGVTRSVGGVVDIGSSAQTSSLPTGAPSMTFLAVSSSWAEGEPEKLRQTNAMNIASAGPETRVKNAQLR